MKAERATCAPDDPRRVVSVEGVTMDKVWEFLVRNDPLMSIIRAGLANGATPDQRASGRKALKRMKWAVDQARNAIYADPLIRKAGRK